MMDRITEPTHSHHHLSYALLTIEQSKLLLPQSEVRTLESVLDIRTEQPPGQGVGWFPFEHQYWPVYGMDTALNSLSKIPDDQRICVLLALDAGYFGLLCSDITTVQRSALELRPLPPAMAIPKTPISALALLGDQTGFVSTAMTLAVYLSVDVEVLTIT